MQNAHDQNYFQGNAGAKCKMLSSKSLMTKTHGLIYIYPWQKRGDTRFLLEPGLRVPVEDIYFETFSTWNVQPGTKLLPEYQY